MEHAPSAYEVPDGMVVGGAFIDRILPMPVDDGLRTNVWGGDNVKPRDADNGLEDPKWSYWCMSVIHGPDGKEHMFAVRWPENSPKGHMDWPQFQLVHAVADRPTGPFKVKQEIGPGHNVDVLSGQGRHLRPLRDRPRLHVEVPRRAVETYDLQYDLRGTAAGRHVQPHLHPARGRQLPDGFARRPCLDQRGRAQALQEDHHRRASIRRSRARSRIPWSGATRSSTT